jgi:hypothetical protein
VIRVSAFVASLVLLICCSAAAEPLARAEYAGKLAKAASGLDQAAAPGGEGKRRAEAALALVPERVQVAVPGEEPVVVDNRELLAALRQQTSRGRDGIQAAARTLRSLQSAVAAPPTLTPANARAVLARVLKRSEFRPSRLARLQAQALAWLKRLLESVFRAVPSFHLGLSRGVQRAILAGLLALSALFTLILVGRIVLGAAAFRRRAQEAQSAASPPPLRSHEQWLAEAEADAASADYATAIRALHMAALMKLDKAGRISYQSSRTDGRFERALRAAGLHEVADVLRELNRLFAAVWYGLAPAGPEQYQRARQQWDRLEAMTSP